MLVAPSICCAEDIVDSISTQDFSDTHPVMAIGAAR